MNINAEIEKLKDLLNTPENQINDNRKEIEKLKLKKTKTQNNISHFNNSVNRNLKNLANKKNRVNILIKENQLKKNFLEQFYSDMKLIQNKEILFRKENINYNLNLSNSLVSLINLNTKIQIERNELEELKEESFNYQ